MKKVLQISQSLMIASCMLFSYLAVAQPSTDINSYVLFANQSLNFKGRNCDLCPYGIIQGGSVGVNACAPVNGNNLTFGGPVIMPNDGEYVVGDRVRIDNEVAHPTSIWRLYANETTNGFDPSVLRDPPVLPWAPCPLLNWAAIPFPDFIFGVTNVTVATGGSLVLPPGDYKDVWVKDNGALYLSAGIYNVKSFKAGKHVTIFTQDGVELRSATFMTFSDDGYVGPANDVKFFIRSDGLNPTNDNSVIFSHYTEFHGDVFVPNGQLNLGHTTKLFGKFWANTITSDWNVNITHQECIPACDLVQKLQFILEALTATDNSVSKSNLNSTNQDSGSDLENSSNATLFPNPSAGNFKLDFSSESERIYNITITDVTGNVVYNKTYEATKGINSQTFDTRNFSKGVYLVRLQSKDSSDVLRLNLQ